MYLWQWNQTTIFTWVKLGPSNGGNPPNAEIRRFKIAKGANSPISIVIFKKKRKNNCYWAQKRMNNLIVCTWIVEIFFFGHRICRPIVCYNLNLKSKRFLVLDGPRLSSKQWKTAALFCSTWLRKEWITRFFVYGSARFFLFWSQDR